MTISGYYTDCVIISVLLIPEINILHTTRRHSTDNESKICLYRSVTYGSGMTATGGIHESLQR